MNLRRMSRFLVLLGLLAAEAAAPADVAAQERSPAITGGPLRKHPTNPRYFTDASGRAIYLTGSHFWTTIQRWDPVRAEAHNPYSGGPAFRTFAEYLRFLTDHHHNFTRLWCFDHFLYASSPSPWLRTGPGAAADGQPRWNVTRVNPEYLALLRDRVRQFRDNGIYVSVMFFRGNSGRGTHPAWAMHPFNPANNVNPETAGLTYDGYNSLDHPGALALQKQYIRAVVDALNDMDNVIWEIANEAQPQSYPWQQHLAEYVRSYERSKPRQHLVGITSTYPNDNMALQQTTADWISPGPSRNRLAYDPNDPPARDGRHIVLSDSDHHLLARATVSWVWKSFVRGEHPVLMENELAWNLEDVRVAMGQTRLQAERMNLAAMTPRTDVSQTAFALANPGTEYLVYAPRGGRFWVDLSAGRDRTFALEWMNPRTGTVVERSSILGGNARQVVVSPINDSGAVLYLKRLGPVLPPRR